MQSTDWPDEHSRMLCELHARGQSYAEIARALNAQFGTAYTRNATLGRGKRMGLVAPAAQKPAYRAEPGSMAVSAGAGRRAQDAGRRPAAAPTAAKPAKPVRLRCVGISPRLLSLDQLEPGDCHYPYGGDRDDDPITFCGHPSQPGSCYCAPHFELTRDPEALADRPAGRPTLRLVAAM